MRAYNTVFKPLLYLPLCTFRRSNGSFSKDGKFIEQPSRAANVYLACRPSHFYLIHHSKEWGNNRKYIRSDKTLFIHQFRAWETSKYVKLNPNPYIHTFVVEKGRTIFEAHHFPLLVDRKCEKSVSLMYNHWERRNHSKDVIQKRIKYSLWCSSLGSFQNLLSLQIFKFMMSLSTLSYRQVSQASYFVCISYHIILNAWYIQYQLDLLTPIRQ